MSVISLVERASPVTLAARVHRPSTESFGSPAGFEAWTGGMEATMPPLPNALEPRRLQRLGFGHAVEVEVFDLLCADFRSGPGIESKSSW